LLEVCDETKLDALKLNRSDYLVDNGIANVNAVTLDTTTRVAVDLLDNFFMYRFVIYVET